MSKKYYLIRTFVQVIFVIVVLKIGYDFYGFVKYCESEILNEYGKSSMLKSKWPLPVDASPPKPMCE